MDVSLSLIWQATAVLAALSLLGALSILIARAVATRKSEGKRTHWTGLADEVFGVLAGHRSASSVHALLGRRDSIRFLELLLSIRGRIRGDEVELLQSLARPFLPAAERLLASKADASRALGVQLCAEFGGAVKPDMLEDPSEMVASAAAFAFARSARWDLAASVPARAGHFVYWGRTRLVSLFLTLGERHTPAINWIVLNEACDVTVRIAALEALVLLGSASVLTTAGDLVARGAPEELLAVAAPILFQPQRRASLTHAITESVAA